MRLQRLETRNFKHLNGEGDRPFVLEFTKGIMGILGPNESGKSSIMQAVFFALFGEPLEGGREIGRYVAYGQRIAEIRLEFEIEGQSYLVYRKIQRTDIADPRSENSSIRFGSKTIVAL